MTGVTLTDDEKRILKRLGGVTICRAAAYPDGEAEFYNTATWGCTLSWPGVDCAGAFATRTGIVVFRSGDRDPLTRKVANPVATLTWKRVKAWAESLPDEMREQAARIAYPYPDYAACYELADRLLGRSTTEPKELTLW
ncbi:hypothetical protein [Rhodococcus pyridinivorans]